MLDRDDSNTLNLHRVHYVSLIKLSLAPIPNCAHRAVQRLHRAIPLCDKEKVCVAVSPQLLALTETH